MKFRIYLRTKDETILIGEFHYTRENQIKVEKWAKFVSKFNHKLIDVYYENEKGNSATFLIRYINGKEKKQHETI